MTAMPARHPHRLVPFAMTSDDASAARWVAALEEAGIPAQIHIEDGSRLASGSSMFPTGPSFASAIYIAPDCRERAAALLIDLGWDGRQLGSQHPSHAVDGRALVSGAIGVTFLALALVVVLWAV